METINLKEESHKLTDNRGRNPDQHPGTHNDFVVKILVKAAGVF